VGQLALVACAVAICTGLAATGPAVAERMVCLVGSTLASGARSGCGGDDGERAARLLHRVQQQVPPHRVGPDGRLREQERHLNTFWGHVRGGRHQPPRVQLATPPDHLASGGIAIPPALGARGVPLIWLDIHVELGQSPRARRLAEARVLFELAHLFGQLADHDPDVRRGPTDDELFRNVNAWQCETDCDAWRERTRRADCYAGAYARWALNEGLIDEETSLLMREAIAAMRPGQPGFPSGAERLRWFLKGFESSQTTPDPGGPCVPTS
jgi:hypothetical protein